jgi:uncharacterized membrane protein
MSYPLAFLSLLGLLISTYFTAVAYRWVSPQTPWVPSFCRMGERTCASIVDSPRARLLGVPNSVLGQLFYTALLASLVTGRLWASPYYQGILAASAATVALGLFLSYSLLFVTRVPCVLCFTSHILNLCIFLLLLLGYLSPES